METNDYTAIHQQAVQLGQALYLDPATGLWVMTAVGLQARGHCCGQGCRHCPYVGTAQEHPGRRHHAQTVRAGPESQ